MTDWNSGGVAQSTALTLREGARMEKGMEEVGRELEQNIIGGGTEFMVFGSVKVLGLGTAKWLNLVCFQSAERRS